MKISVPVLEEGMAISVDISDVLDLILVYEGEVLTYEGDVLYYED